MADITHIRFRNRGLGQRVFVTRSYPHDLGDMTCHWFADAGVTPADYIMRKRDLTIMPPKPGAAVQLRML